MIRADPARVPMPTAQLLGTKELADMEAAWATRVKLCPDATIFSSPLVQNAYRQAFELPKAAAAIAASVGDQLAGLLTLAPLPLSVGPFTLHETGFPRNTHTLRNHLLADAGPAAIRAILSAWLVEAGGETLILENLPAASHSAEEISQVAGGLGLLSDLPNKGRRLEYATMAGNYEDYRATRSGQFRRQIRKRIREIGEMGRLSITALRSGDIEDAMPKWRQVVGQSWQGKGSAPGDGNSPADWNLHGLLSGNGTLWLLNLDDRPVAALRMLEDERGVYVHTMHFDQAMSALAPGVVLFDAMMRDSAERGVGIVDFNGSSVFFSRWATGHADHFTIRLYRPTARGRAAKAIRAMLRLRRQGTDAPHGGESR